MRIGLTGGVGSGKSTAAAMFGELGAVVIDADAIAREVVQNGTSGFDAVVAEFGDGIVAADGSLDRSALAEVVFADKQLLARLNAIVHPLVAQRVAELEKAAPDGSVIVYDVPLLVENDMAAGFDLVVVVLADLDTRLRRLSGRGMSEDDARARMARQADDAQRRTVADEVIENNGDLDDLRAAVDRVWHRIGSTE